MADRSVRPGRPADAAAVGGVQSRAWRTAYGGVLPEAVLAGLDPDALAQAWRDAVVAPPTERHRLLVAVEGDEVVGFAASGPAADADLHTATDAELLALVVDPRHGRAGHGSRLLAATVDLLREDGVRRAVTWLLDGDPATRGFLAGAGWGPDGATRGLDAGGTTLAQSRFHTDIAP